MPTGKVSTDEAEATESVEDTAHSTHSADSADSTGAGVLSAGAPTPPSVPPNAGVEPDSVVLIERTRSRQIANFSLVSLSLRPIKAKAFETYCT